MPPQSPGILDRPIAFHRSFIYLTGSINAALFLSQALYWAHRTTLPDRWFYKTGEDWQKETGLTRTQLETARKLLRKFKWYQEELRGLPARLYYRIDVIQMEEELRACLAEIYEQERIEDAGTDAENLAANTDTTSENKSKTTAQQSALLPWWDAVEDQLVKRICAAYMEVPKFAKEGPPDQERTLQLVADVRAMAPSDQAISFELPNWVLFNKNKPNRGGKKDGLQGLRNWYGNKRAGWAVEVSKQGGRTAATNGTVRSGKSAAEEAQRLLDTNGALF
jgi:hypothetical protein